MSVPVLDLVAAIQLRLKPLAPSLDDEAALAHLDSPPRYVWVEKDAQTGNPKGTGDYPAPQAPAIFWDVWRFEVHCWSTDKANAFELRRALLKAANELCGGLVKVGKTSVFGGESFGTCGWVHVVELFLPSPVLDEPISPETLTPEPRPANGVAQATKTVFEVPIGTAGDGGLTHGED